MREDELTAAQVAGFLKIHAAEIELQAFKLSRFYAIDLHEIYSRTAETVWQNWKCDLQVRTTTEQLSYALKVAANHARNLNRARIRKDADLTPPEVLARIDLPARDWEDPASQAIANEHRFDIYRAISQLRGRERDVLALMAIGFDHSSIMEELGMSRTNFTSTLSRARRSLRNLLESMSECEVTDEND